ncbi:MAG TPA: OsmC family protein [Pseudomonadales bacterium]|nr:OsmC family protein [Pseudomonadales bacterium]
MQPMPHHYQVRAHATAEGDVTLSADTLPDLASAAPPEFDGPGGRWSPETLLTAAVADCFVLSFRAVATASAFAYAKLACSVTGTLDRIDRRTAFTAFEVHVQLTLAADGDDERARSLLEKAEALCLVSNSLNAPTTLQIEILRT